MDIFAHSLYSGALLKGVTKQKEKKKQFFWALFWGAFPDLFAFTIPFISTLITNSWGNRLYDAGSYVLAEKLYDFSHSLVIFSVVFLIVWHWKKNWKLPMLGWGLHILFDIPTHSIEFFPTPFLFPISEFRFPYGIPWSTPWIWIGSWVGILLVYGYFYFRNKYFNTNKSV